MLEADTLMLEAHRKRTALAVEPQHDEPKRVVVDPRPDHEGADPADPPRERISRLRGAAAEVSQTAPGTAGVVMRGRQTSTPSRRRSCRRSRQE